jgi:hypothetical protein
MMKVSQRLSSPGKRIPVIMIIITNLESFKGSRVERDEVGETRLMLLSSLLSLSLFLLIR